MSALSIQSTAPKVVTHNGKAVTSSIAVADYFQKTHDNVLKKIRSVIAECDEEYRLVNFNETSYTRENPNGGAGISTPMFELTRDAFVLIVMGFTGKKALQWKIDYINAFNKMESKLRELAMAESELPVADGHANRTEVIYYQDFKPIFCRTLTKGEIVISHESMMQWLEKRGLIFFTRNELKTMTHGEWLSLVD